MDEVMLNAGTGRTQRAVWHPAQDGGRGAAVILPGLGYTPAHPLLHFAGRVLRTSGFDVLAVWYDYSGIDLQSLDSRERGELLGADAEAALAEADSRGSDGERLVVGKSIGTLHMAELARRGHLAGTPSVWLTPLLARDTVADTLADQVAPTLVVAGGDDPATPSEALADLRSHSDPALQVTVIAGADHALERAAPLDAVDALGQAVQALAEFVVGLRRQ